MKKLNHSIQLLHVNSLVGDHEHRFRVNEPLKSVILSAWCSSEPGLDLPIIQDALDNRYVRCVNPKPRTIVIVVVRDGFEDTAYDWFECWRYDGASWNQFCPIPENVTVYYNGLTIDGHYIGLEQQVFAELADRI